MSYAIAHIVYGIPLQPATGYLKRKWSEELEELIEAADDDEVDGFVLPYSGSSDSQQAAFGILLGEFDEACHHIELSELRLTPTEVEVNLFQKNFNNLTETIQEELSGEKYGVPRVFILWGTS